MAYRFKLSEPISVGFQRIGTEQIDRALQELGQAAVHSAGDGATAGIHGARKGLKRIRALLKLARIGLGEEVYQRENARYRDLGAGLAPARDQVVRVETALMLEAAYPENLAILAMRRVLQEDLLSAEKLDLEKSVAAACAGLMIGRKKFVRLAEGFRELAVFEHGLEQGYRRAVRRLEQAVEDPQDEVLHDWRKAVQVHWRHMALCQNAWPAYFDARIEAAKQLSQLLGEDHDLSILASFVGQMSPDRLMPRLAQQAVSIMRERQGVLRAEAEQRGRLLFAESAAAHAGTVMEMWRAAGRLKDVLGGAEASGTDGSSKVASIAVGRKAKFSAGPVQTLPEGPDATKVRSRPGPKRKPGVSSQGGT